MAKEAPALETREVFLVKIGLDSKGNIEAVPGLLQVSKTKKRRSAVGWRSGS